MNKRQYLANWLKIYNYRYRSGTKSAFIPFVFLYIITRLIKFTQNLKKSINANPRPSKSFLYDLLESKLRTIRGQVGLDAASAHFKNRTFFKTRQYYGLDIDLAGLRKGIQKYNDHN